MLYGDLFVANVSIGSVVSGVISQRSMSQTRRTVSALAPSPMAVLRIL